MQHVSCTVRIQASEQAHPIDVVKKDITVAEVVVLQAMHGDDRVMDVRPIYWRQTNMRAELDRLGSIYRPEIVAGVYPGAAPRLPLRLSDIGMTPGAEATPLATPDLPAGDQVSREAEETERRIQAEVERRLRAAGVNPAPAPVELAEAEAPASYDDPEGDDPEGDGGDGMGGFDEPEAEAPIEKVAPVPAALARVAPEVAKAIAESTGARIEQPAPAPRPTRVVRRAIPDGPRVIAGADPAMAPVE